MYYKTCLFFCVINFLSVWCDLNKNAGEACEWEGVQGTCVDIHRCLTSLDEKSAKQPACSQKGSDTIICCTDCELVNDTRNAVIPPTGHLYWKNGEGKAWDTCLSYVMDLPYECHSSYYSKLSRSFNEEKKCHQYGMWGVGGPPPLGGPPKSSYPYMAMLSYDSEVGKKYQCTGAIISQRYILTSADCTQKNGGVKQVVLGIVRLSDKPESWQVRKVKKTVVYPDAQSPYLAHNIALLETETPITFNNNVLPACLHLDENYDDFANIPTWKDSEGTDDLVNPMRGLYVKPHSIEDCSSDASYNDTVHVCYGAWEQGLYDGGKNHGGEPLLGNNGHISSCVHTILGVTFSPSTPHQQKTAEKFTKVAYYLPWIESVVWP